MVSVRNLTSAPAILKDIRSSLTWSSPTPVPLVSTYSSPPRYLVTCLENNKRRTVFLLQLCNLAPRTSPLAFGLHTSSQAKGVVLGTMLAIVGPGHSPPLKKNWIAQSSECRSHVYKTQGNIASRVRSWNIMDVQKGVHLKRQWKEHLSKRERA